MFAVEPAVADTIRQVFHEQGELGGYAPPYSQRWTTWNTTNEILNAAYLLRRHRPASTKRNAIVSTSPVLINSTRSLIDQSLEFTLTNLHFGRSKPFDDLNYCIMAVTVPIGASTPEAVAAPRQYKQPVRWRPA